MGGLAGVKGNGGCAVEHDAPTVRGKMALPIGTSRTQYPQLRGWREHMYRRPHGLHTTSRGMEAQRQPGPFAHMGAGAWTRLRDQDSAGSGWTGSSGVTQERLLLGCRTLTFVSAHNLRAVPHLRTASGTQQVQRRWDHAGEEGCRLRVQDMDCAGNARLASLPLVTPYTRYPRPRRQARVRPQDRDWHPLMRGDHRGVPEVERGMAG
jgi:hypothetical protein